MKKHTESHLDHNLTDAQIAFVLARFADRAAFFIEAVTLPDELGTVPCDLHGPLTGDPPVPEAEVARAKRGSRAWTSRLVERPAKPSRVVTVIAGPHEETCPRCAGSGVWYGLAIPPDNPWECRDCVGGKLKHACILYTCYGGPLAPQEPGDLRRQIEALEEQRRALPDCSPENAEHTALYAKIVALREKRDQADAFWATHALSRA